MVGLSRVIILLVLALVAYGLWPLYTALEIRQAVVAGDTATLTCKIEWEPLRASLKTSLSPETIAKLAADPDAPKPTLWQRFKAAVAPKVADTVIDLYVTPEYLPVLLGYRRIYRGTIQPALLPQEPPTMLAGTFLDGTGIDRFASFWSRVRRAVFLSPTRFELEVQDRFNAGRRYTGTFELKGWEWKLTGLSVTGGGL
jgi:hypothetical protein